MNTVDQPPTYVFRPSQRFTLEQLTSPEIEPLTLAQMKRHLRAFDEITDEDEEIQSLFKTAREWVEGFTGRILIDQTWRLTIENYVGEEILLRKSPVIEVLSMASVDDDGTLTAIAAADYAVMEPDSKWPRLLPVTSWTTGRLRIEFRAGFADRLGSPTDGPEVIPVRFLQAMKLYAEALYDRDSRMMDVMITAAENLIRPEKAEFGVA